MNGSVFNDNVDVLFFVLEFSVFEKVLCFSFEINKIRNTAVVV